MNLFKAILAINLCLLAACQEPAVSPAAEEKAGDPPKDGVDAKQDATLKARGASLVGQSSKCPPDSTPFNLAPWLSADITVACGLRSKRTYVTKAGIARFQITYEYTAGTALEELDALGSALKSAGFSEKPGADAQSTGRAYFKKGHGSVNVWANPEKKPNFKDPLANGAIGIDMPDIATAAPIASAD